MTTLHEKLLLCSFEPEQAQLQAKILDAKLKSEGATRDFPAGAQRPQAAEGRGVDLSEVSDRGRDGITGKRERGHIGFQN